MIVQESLLIKLLAVRLFWRTTLVIALEVYEIDSLFNVSYLTVTHNSHGKHIHKKTKKKSEKEKKFF